MKTLSKSNLFTTLLLMIFSFGIIVFWGCEKQEVTSEADIIVETEEFQEYLSAYINMVNELQNVKNGPRKKIGEKNGHILYQHQTIDASIYKKTIKARNKLISKYPEYQNILSKEKALMAIDCINKSPKLLQLIGTDNQSIRLKSGSPEDGDDDKTYADWRVESFDDHDGQFNATAFDSFDDAVSEMRNYGSANNVECAVWKLSDGSTVFITDSEATSDSMTIPYLESNISTDAIGHYHPSGDCEMSDDDWDAFDDWHEAGVDTSLIITQDSICTYTYE